MPRDQDPCTFTYTISWSSEDNEYVATCSEFPGLSWIEENPESALHGLRNVIREVIADMISNGEIHA